MRGHFHIIALSAASAAISVIFDRYLFIFVIVWLIYLYIDQRLKFLSVTLAILSIFFFYNHIPSLEAEEQTLSETEIKQIFTGEIASEPVINENKSEFILKDADSEENYMVIHFPENELPAHSYLEQIKYGAFCKVEGIAEIPSQARNPGQFDYQHYLLTQNITYQIIINDLDNINCHGSSLPQRFFTLRNMLLGQSPSKISDFTSSWLNALVLGDRTRIDESTIDLFQKWSLTHLLAISGLHIGIIVAIVYFGLIKLNLLTREKAEVILFLFLPVYAVLAGGQPSVLRAVFMVVILLLSSRLNIKLRAIDSISIAFIILLLLDPYIIYHIGFQFSFIVSFSIILSGKWLGFVSSPLFKVFIISFVSQMVILPLQLHYFSLFQPLSILLNLIIVPYFSIFVIPFMFLLLITSFLPEYIFTVLDQLFNIIHQMVLSFIELVDRLFSFPLYLGEIPLWLFALYYFLLLLAHYLLDKKRRKDSFIVFLLLIFLVFGYASKPYFSEKGTVTMLDIGQGDAFIIELPYRKGIFMIDAGAHFSFEDMEPTNTVYKQIIQPYLKYRGIHKLDAIFLTHDDIDHTGSLQFMITDGVADTIYISAYFPGDVLMDNIKNENVIIQSLKDGDIVEVGGHPILTLGPREDKYSSNENSLVLFSKIGGINWLFTGDITADEEKELLENYNLKADVLKVAHHGSNTSTDHSFIESIEATAALISVGENNRYNHPTEEVIETLKRNDMEIYRTDQHGAVQYKFIKESGLFQSFMNEFKIKRD